MEQLIVALFLGFFLLEFFVEFCLNELNLRHVRARWAAKEIPSFFRDKIASAEYQKSVEYTLAKGAFGRWSEIYGRIVTLIVLFSGILPWADQIAAALTERLPLFNYAQGIAFCLIVGAIFSLVGLPIELYSTFRLEARFGFNKMTVKLFVADKIKGLLVGLVIGVPFLLVILWLMQATGSHWWLWAFAFISAFQLLMIVIYPTLIAPLFNKFEPLKEGEFRDRILRLAEQIGFKTTGIFTMDGSKRSGHSNAYFTGLGKAKRIVLFDTLIEQMTSEQGLAVLAHEMGHYKLKHIRRMLVVQTIFLLVGLYVLSLLRESPAFFAAFGLTPSNHAALVLFSLVTGPLIFYLAPLMNRLSRQHEYKADAFAKKTLNTPQPMIEALVDLTIKNLSNLTPHPWYSAYHYSHPTPTERIAALL
ncbi:MAG: M48 family metallopeptidase [Deltaproteobacteria bacterium]|nr:M48 family metallopeptidase [Deltaproteobacteria bacterium]MBM4297232.1 M48 family metallopeptidase [Deltaproteobacteria bacterium]